MKTFPSDNVERFPYCYVFSSNKINKEETIDFNKPKHMFTNYFLILFDQTNVNGI